MSCWLCGHEKEKSHHLGCARIALPELEKWQAVEMGLLAPSDELKPAAPDVVEVLKPGTMSTEPVDNGDETPAKGGETVGQCEFAGCDNPKYSASHRAKWCEAHRDPKNRKE